MLSKKEKHIQRGSGKPKSWKAQKNRKIPHKIPNKQTQRGQHNPHKIPNKQTQHGQHGQQNPHKTPHNKTKKRTKKSSKFLPKTSEQNNVPIPIPIPIINGINKINENPLGIQIDPIPIINGINKINENPLGIQIEPIYKNTNTIIGQHNTNYLSSIINQNQSENQGRQIVPIDETLINTNMDSQDQMREYITKYIFYTYILNFNKDTIMFHKNTNINTETKTKTKKTTKFKYNFNYRTSALIKSIDKIKAVESSYKYIPKLLPAAILKERINSEILINPLFDSDTIFNISGDTVKLENNIRHTTAQNIDNISAQFDSQLYTLLNNNEKEKKTYIKKYTQLYQQLGNEKYRANHYSFTANVNANLDLRQFYSDYSKQIDKLFFNATMLNSKMIFEFAFNKVSEYISSVTDKIETMSRVEKLHDGEHLTLLLIDVENILLTFHTLYKKPQTIEMTDNLDLVEIMDPLYLVEIILLYIVNRYGTTKYLPFFFINNLGKTSFKSYIFKSKSFDTHTIDFVLAISNVNKGALDDCHIIMLSEIISKKMSKVMINILTFDKMIWWEKPPQCCFVSMSNNCFVDNTAEMSSKEKRGVNFTNHITYLKSRLKTTTPIKQTNSRSRYSQNKKRSNIYEADILGKTQKLNTIHENVIVSDLINAQTLLELNFTNIEIGTRIIVK